MVIAMVDDPKNTAAAAEAAHPKPFKFRPKPKPKSSARRQYKLEREQSSISFPYMDLEAGIAVANAILRGGGVAVTRDQLAGLMNLAAGSGNFVQKVATARIFGLVAFVGGKYELSNLGFDILDSDEGRQKAARKTAFLTVPLYKRTYDEFRGKQLPPRPLGLEQAFVKFGVAQKQKTNARLAFDKSASQAGFFLNGPDRLIEPIVGSSPMIDRGRSAEQDEERDAPASERLTPDALGLHPFIQGLLDTLPAPQTMWSIEGRAKWLQAAANIFDLIYQGNGEIDIRARSEPNSIATDTKLVQG